MNFKIPVIAFFSMCLIAFAQENSEYIKFKQLLLERREECIKDGLRQTHPTVIEIDEMVNLIDALTENNNKETRELSARKFTTVDVFGISHKAVALYVSSERYDSAEKNIKAHEELLRMVSDNLRKKRILMLFPSEDGALLVCDNRQIGLVYSSFSKGNYPHKMKFGQASDLFKKHCLVPIE